MKKILRFYLLVALICNLSESVLAQRHYTFNCRDYVSTDDTRAPQSKFTYDKEANTFSIHAGGQNNIAFKMHKALDNEYYIDNDETMLLVCGENLRTWSTDSYVWWLNGFNDRSQTAPDLNIAIDSDAVFIWDLSTNKGVNKNFDFNKSQIFIGTYGEEFILAAGFTATNASRPGIIKDFGYYAPYEVAAKHPSLMASLGFDSTSLTEALKAKTLKLDTQLANQLEAVASTDYAAAYALYLQARKSADTGDTGEHTGSYEPTPNGIMARFDDQYIRIMYYNDSTVRVSKAFDTDFGYDSWAVEAQPDEAVSLRTTESDGVVCIESSKLRVDYVLDAGRATFYDAQGNPLLEEGSHRFVPTTDGPFDSYTLTQTLRLADDERIYGMGQIQDGQLDRRGTLVRLEQENRTISIPYFLSSKSYGFYWDNYSPTVFNDLGNETFFRSLGTAIDYYVLSGTDSHAVQRSLRHLTGTTQLPPLWNFGLYQSRERYTSVAQVMDIVQKYRELQIPFDCLVQDWQYWGDDAHWNALSFLNPSYADYQTMIDFIHEHHAKIMISIWPSFGPATDAYAEYKSKGMLFTSETWPRGAGVRHYNAYSSEARDIYWKYLWSGLASKGIDAYWMDSTEPDFFGVPTDLDFEVLKGRTWRSLRNAYPLAAVEGVSDHHRAQLGDAGKRVSIMTRSGYLGMQRTGAYVWSADITSSWETLKQQIPAACNLTECGLPYWNSDTGGFFVANYGGGVNNAAWRRLYTRWNQFSTFTPMLRYHGTDTPREPWQFGKAGDAAGEYDNIVRYIKLRYRLLPYLYATAHQVRVNAEGFMQAMPIAFPADSATYDITDQYMFGRSFLVAPVVEDHVATRDVYLPAGTRWIDFWTGISHRGGQVISKDTPADIMPLYVRAGSIIPWGPDVQYTTEKPWDTLEIRIYPGADGHFALYEDEFDNYNYESGQYTEIPFAWDDTLCTLTIGDRKGSYAGMLANRQFRIVVVSPDKGVADSDSSAYDRVVTYTGTTQHIQFNANAVVVLNHDQKSDNTTYNLVGQQVIAPQGGILIMERRKQYIK